MHYLHKPLNEYEYFPHFAAIGFNPKSPTGLNDKIIKFLYRSSCLFMSYHLIQKSASDSVELAFGYLKQIKFNEENRISFSCSELFLAYSQIPSALSAISLMQNELIGIIPLITGEGKDLPDSMSKVFYRGIEKFEFSEKLSCLLEGYWNNGGKYVRDLRNINEHYDILVDYTFFEFNEILGKILIFLPDNPEVKIPKDFKYEQENNAQTVIYDAMNSLNNLVNDICNLYGLEKGKFLPISISKKLEKFDYDKETTLSLMISVEEVLDGKKGLHAMEMKYLGKGAKGEPLLSYKPIGLDKDLK